MSDLALTDQRVLVTRPHHQAAPLCDLLQQQGAEAIAFPTLAIEPVEACGDKPNSLKRYFMELDRYHAVIFVSANAARFGHHWIDDYWPQLPIGIAWLAVGEATAKLLRSYDIPAQTANGGMDSEHLLDTQALKDVADKHILICRGEGGREHLQQQLCARGAKVDYAELYRRVRPHYDEYTITTIIYNQLPTVVVVTSNQVLENLDHICQGALGTLPIHRLREVPLIVPSARVADNAHRLGYTRVQLAANASDQAILAAIQNS